MKNSKSRSLFKKTLAAVLSLTLAFGCLMLPESFVRDELTTASAAICEANGCQFEYNIDNDRGVYTLSITGIKEHGETVEIPATITHDGVEYPVYKIDNSFLENDQTVKTVIFPETVKRINMSVLYNSSVEDITLPDGLEHLGVCFAGLCPNLRSVTYHGTSMKSGEVGWNIFIGSNLSGITNEKGAVVLGNWLLKYTPAFDVVELKPSSLSTTDIPVENIAPDTFYGGDYPVLKTLDLDGIKCISLNNFVGMKSLTTVVNYDDLDYVYNNVFHGTPWYENAEKNDVVRLGKMLLYYKTDSNTLDFTSGDLKGVVRVGEGALDDCKNIEKVIVNSDCDLSSVRFNVINEPYEEDSFREDPLPEKPVYNIKELYLDGQKMTYQYLIENPTAHAWMKANFNVFKGSEFINKMIEEKTKELFRQLDITYYGTGNDKVGTLSPTEEFYIRLKISNYINEYGYDYLSGYHGMASAFLLGGKVQCDGYVELIHYLLECAGVEAKTFFADPTDPNTLDTHFFNATKLGDEWFMCDDGWSAQTYRDYGWFLMSYNKFNTSEYHTMMDSYDSFHFYPESKNTEKITADRFYGDQDGDEDRDQDDVDMLWAYIKGNSAPINKKRADMNFDGKVDVTDAVLLEHMVKGHAIDLDNIPIDGLASGVCIAFINGNDYDNIKYVYTERGGYITLPTDLFEAPEGKKVTYDMGRAGQRVRITTPLTVVKARWIDKNAVEYDLGDVNGDQRTDIEDAVAVIQHINGITALSKAREERADVSKDKKIDIDDVVMIISYINGNSTF